MKTAALIIFISIGILWFVLCLGFIVAMCYEEKPNKERK